MVDALLRCNICRDIRRPMQNAFAHFNAAEILWNCKFVCIVLCNQTDGENDQKQSAKIKQE